MFREAYLDITAPPDLSAAFLAELCAWLNREQPISLALEGGIGAITQTSLDLVTKTIVFERFTGVICCASVVLLNERFWGCLKNHATIPLLKALNCEMSTALGLFEGTALVVYTLALLLLLVVVVV